MNTQLNTGAIRQLLNRSAGQLDQSTLDALRRAREQAMSRHNPAKRRARWLHDLLFWMHRHTAATAMATLVLTLTLTGGVVYLWPDNSDLDMAILTDEAPVSTLVE